MLRGCELMMGKAKADEMQWAVEELEGGPCPCRVGAACPILPATLRLAAVDQSGDGRE